MSHLVVDWSIYIEQSNRRTFFENKRKSIEAQKEQE